MFPAPPAGATFPGTLGRIAFYSNRTGNYEIFAMDRNGKDVRQLTTDPASECCPAFSPDGSRIVFQSRRDGNAEVYVMNADGSGQTRITNEPALDSRPDWSPDGNRIIFTSQRDGDREIFIMDADGSNVTQLTNNTERDDAAHISPDGREIVFQRLLPSNRIVVLKMAIDGTGEEQMTPDALNGAEPDWSPDGGRDHTCPLPECAVYSDLHVMNADGSDDRQITHAADTGRGGLLARWAPDGKHIVFVDAVGLDCINAVCLFDIFTIKDDGQSLKRLTNSPDVDDIAGSWGPK